LSHLLVNQAEENFAKISDAQLPVSEKIFLTLIEKPKNYLKIMNCPEYELVNKPIESNYFKFLFIDAIGSGDPERFS